MRQLIYTILPMFFVLFINCNSNTKRISDNDRISDAKSLADTNSTYTVVSPKRLAISSYPNFTIDYAYKFEELTYIFGRYSQRPNNLPKNDFDGIRLLVIDSDNKMIFRSRGSADSYSLTPTFYKLDSKSPIFILAEVGDEGGSWGNVVFMIQNNRVKSIGDINLGVPKKEDDLITSVSNIGEFIRIMKIGKDFQFDFDVDTVYFDPLGVNEKTYDGRKIHYLYDNMSFRLIEK